MANKVAIDGNALAMPTSTQAPSGLIADTRARALGFATTALGWLVTKILVPVNLQRTHLLGDKHGNRN